MSQKTFGVANSTPPQHEATISYVFGKIVLAVMWRWVANGQSLWGRD